ncbi:hypothetical protein RIF29_00886 [Crotalaria pallida]|uniref:Uncharacterized protein n=1 Tax=Crotalaria pallida TaxID=3830 RepID=A0AAN9IW91_CROPI
MAKKRGKLKSSPSSSSPSRANVSKSQNDSVNHSPLNLDLLEEQETEFRDLFESLDSMNEEQVNALLENMDPKVQEQLKEGLIPPERVNEAELHPVIVENAVSQVGNGNENQIPDNVKAGAAS